MAARSTEERIALIDAKISKKQEEIKTLEAQKQKLLPGDLRRHGSAPFFKSVLFETERI